MTETALPSSIGEILERAIKRLGKKRTQVAYELGVTTSMISYWHNDKRLPTKSKLNQIFDVYQLDEIERTQVSQIIKETLPPCRPSQIVKGDRIFSLWIKLPKKERIGWLKVMQAYEASGVE